MEILMASAELSPFTGDGECGEAVAALGRALVQLGHSVTVALPRYGSFESRGLLVARRLTPLRTSSGDSVTVFDGQLGSGVKLVLLDSPGLYDRPGVFGEGGKDYPDNARRFGLFGHAVAALCQQRAEQGQGFDVVHAHDWPGGTAALAISQADVPLPKVVSVHDAARVGNFPLKELGSLGLTREGGLAQTARVGNRVHVLQGAVAVADLVVTDSPTYARALTQDAQGGALAPLLASLVPQALGILPGLDYARDNPTTDAALYRRYNAESWEAKGLCKTDLVRSLELDFDPRRPLLLAMGPLTKADGFDLVLSALPRLLGQDVALVAAGSGSTVAKGLVKSLSARSYRERDNYAFIESADEAMQHRLLAAADLFLSPLPYDRMALSTRRAQRYGAVPVAHHAGAVQDALIDCDASLATGTGFAYHRADTESLLGAVGRGLSAVRHPGWGSLVRRVMRLDSAWEAPARRYLKAYHRACA